MKLISEASAEKLRGGFYTPLPIAEFILKWAINGDQKCDVLEPSCGDGVFLESIKDLNGCNSKLLSGVIRVSYSR